MLGFIIGAACAVGIAKMLRRRAWHARYGYGGYGHGCGALRDGRWRRFRRRLRRHGIAAAIALPERRWALRALFERLETTPGQERVILAALDELSENRKAVRDEARQTRVDLAHAVEGGLIEDTTLDDAFARHDRMLARLRVGFTEALKKVVEVLDEPQRKQLARWLEGGFFRGGAVPDRSGPEGRSQAVVSPWELESAGRVAPLERDPPSVLPELEDAEGRDDGAGDDERRRAVGPRQRELPAGAGGDGDESEAEIPDARFHAAKHTASAAGSPWPARSRDRARCQTPRRPAAPRGPPAAGRIR